MSNITHQQCWAKTIKDTGMPGINVYQHSKATQYVCEQLLSFMLEKVKSPLKAKYAPLLAVTHDIGKLDLNFQTKCMEWSKTHSLPIPPTGEKNHATISQYFLGAQKEFGNYALISGMHHGKLSTLETDDLRISKYSGFNIWETVRSNFFNEVIDQKIYEEMKTDSLSLKHSDEPILWFLSGIISISDWIASNEDYFPTGKLDMDDTELRIRAEKAIQNIGFSIPQVKEDISFNEAFGFNRNNMQKTVESINCNGGDIMVIEAPMGLGKTEAALWLAYLLSKKGENRGIYFAMPSQLTSNKIYERFSKFIGNIMKTESSSIIKLAHSMSWLVEDKGIMKISGKDMLNEEKQDGYNWFNSPKRSLLANFGVGTIDQALMGAINVKHRAVRLSGLAGKVVIFDEVHSYDVYTGSLLKELISLLKSMGCTIIILSATLTKQKREELLGIESSESSINNYPLITLLRKDSTIAEYYQVPVEETVKPKNVLLTIDRDGISKALTVAKNGGCVIYYKNTVKEAQKLYRLLKSEVTSDGIEVVLLHSRFPWWRRQELEKKWIEKLGKEGDRPKNGCILVATQVAEQSVDIDGDLVITDLCPIDMLLQRVGRLQRHSTNIRKGVEYPEVVVCTPCSSFMSAISMDEKSIYNLFSSNGLNIYDSYVLFRTWMELEKFSNKTISIPEDIRGLLENVYSEMTPLNEMMRVFKKQVVDKWQIMKSLAGQSIDFKSSDAAKDEDEGLIAKTRISAYDTVPVLLVTGYNAGSSTVSLTLLDGTSYHIQRGNFNMNMAKGIANNIVHIPTTSKLLELLPTDWQSGQWLKEEKYLFDQCLVIEMDGNVGGVLENLSKGCHYDSSIGLEIIK